jgi:hypothetical protein
LHRDELSQESGSREGDIQAACRHWFKDPKVRVVGPHGEVQTNPEHSFHAGIVIVLTPKAPCFRLQQYMTTTYLPL